jgi:hypothetical protein
LDEKMRALQETTSDWSHKVSNHIYYVTDDRSKLVAFYNIDTKQVKKFSKPLPFYTKHRTFKELK